MTPYDLSESISLCNQPTVESWVDPHLGQLILVPMKLVVLIQLPLSWKEVPHPLQFRFADNIPMFLLHDPQFAMSTTIGNGI